MARERVTAFTDFYKQQADRLTHGPAGGGQISRPMARNPREIPNFRRYEMEVEHSARNIQR
jgi:hypothetical protein